jgi:hypothetical protein
MAEPAPLCPGLFNAIRVKVRGAGTVRNKAVYVALGVRPDGTKEILGLWIEQSEGAKFWLRVMNELRDRGVEDVLIAIVDGLIPALRRISATGTPSAPCFKMNTFCASENCDAFIVLRSLRPATGYRGKLY